jgi:uncharacterized protein DUF4190
MLPGVRDRSATRALVLGLLSLVFGILSPFAILSGSRSLSRIRASHGELRGTGSALAGLLAGMAGAAFLIAGVLYWLVAS